MDLWTPFSDLSSRPNAEGVPSPNDIARQLSGEQLITAEILYALPDYPCLLQTYIWQDYDMAPRFPLLRQFIEFWQRDIEGKLQRVTVSVRETLGDARFTFYADEFLT